MTFFSFKLYAADIKGNVSLQGETLNFELTGQKNWDYDIRRVKDKAQSKIQLYVKSLDSVAIEKIKNIENPFIKSIQVVPNALDNKWMVEFVLKSNQVETFDYLTDQPSKLIVDFYLGDSVAEDNEGNAKADNAKNTFVEKTKVKTATKSSKRKPADVDVLKIEDLANNNEVYYSKAGLFDGGDAKFTRFTMRDADYKEESVIKSRNNYYLKFPILESEFAFWNKMKENPPVYEIQKKNTEENKQARLLTTLFAKKRFLVFLKTAEWFKEKFPQSEYMEMLSFMSGDALTEVWKAQKGEAIYEQAMNAYRQAIQNYPNSMLVERTSLMVGMLAIDKHDYMAAIRHLNAHIENKLYEQKPSKHYARLGLAHSYAKINKLDEALALLGKVEKETKDEILLAEIQVRKGDFYFTAKKFDEACATYDQAIKKYDFVSKAFPSAFFNKIEGQFWKSKYKESHQSAIEFVRNFPAHPFAPYALTRVGELLDILGAEQSQSVGAYLETHFRYGESPKTIVARLHLLSTRMKSMKAEELEETLKKMDQLAEKSELQNVDQFKIAMVSDGFSRRKEYRRAISILSKFFQENPTRVDSKQVTERIVRNISDELKHLIDQKNYKDVLKTYREYADTWIKKENRIDTDYLLAQAYDFAGAYDISAEKYTKTLDRIFSIKGKANEKSILVNEYLPSVETLYLKIAKNKFENKSYQEAYAALEKIKKPLELSDEEQIERVQLAANLFDQKGDHDTAIRYLSEISRLWNGNSELLLPILIRLAELQANKNDVTDSIKNYQRAFETVMSQDNPDAKVVSGLMNSYMQLLKKQNREDDVVAALSQLVNKFGEKLSLSQEKYNLGELYFKKGELKRAEQTWGLLKGEDADIWIKLSSEKLKQASWDEDYKKHLKRIPAMSRAEEQK